MSKKILVVGGGGREHAIIKALKKSPDCGEIWCAPGNGGISYDAKCKNIKSTDVDTMVGFAVEEKFDYVVVAQDDPLALGMVDALAAVGIPAFGPDKAAARIEASKVFSKDLMKKYGIPTAKYETFDDPAKVMEYIKAEGKYPVVIKADGLALGKGVLICENEQQAADGVKEIMVIAEDTSAYGSDLGYKLAFAGGRPVHTRLEDLCVELGRLGLWIRLHYVYPYPMVDRIIPLMAEGKILPYLDIPLQHADPDVLRRMARPAHAEKTLERIRKWREICPDLTIRSSFVVGFPGETEEEFQHLLDFIREAELDRVGCFTYSPVDGAKANDFPDAVPDDVKEDRRRRFMEVQAEVSAAKLKRRIGNVETVLIDEPEDEDGVAVGRTAHEAPEVDGVVYVTVTRPVKPGEFVRAKIVRTEEHDLVALQVEE